MASGKVVPLQSGRSGKTIWLDPNAAHARIYSAWRHLDAFKSLSPLQRVILEDFLADFSQVAGNEVRLTSSGIMRKHEVGRKKAKTAIAGLEERGWIQRIGLGPGPTGQVGGVYEILCLDATGRRVAGPYMYWKAPAQTSELGLPNNRIRGAE